MNQYAYYQRITSLARTAVESAGNLEKLVPETPGTSSLLEAIKNSQIGIIEDAEGWYGISSTDALTGLKTRRHLEEALGHLFEETLT
jgi:GGDEF domain-containing protein